LSSDAVFSLQKEEAMIGKRTLQFIFLLSILLFRGVVTAQDPAVVNASTIHVKLENNRVRVLEAILKPGDQEQLHSHPAYVIYVIAGGKTRSHMPDGKAREQELKTGDVIYRDPLTHWAENIGTTTIHLILVELKNAH
jgi:quercetin dioxygenase-like cupin family protein